MERFLERHRDRIVGTLEGFDRVLFRGTLRSIAHAQGMRIYLYSKHILMKDFGNYAQSLSQRIVEHGKQLASKWGRPYIYLPSSKDAKEELARKIIEQDKVEQGLICVFGCVEPCQSFDLRKDRQAKELQLIAKERKCLHLYFYYLDREFGLMHVRLQTWLPFSIQVCVNGREWLAGQLERAGISYIKRDNCFTQIADLARAQKLMDRLTNRKWQRFLDAIARTVNPLIKPGTGFDVRSYYWSVRQMEYATDVMFSSDGCLTEVYPQLVQHGILQLGSKDIMRYLQRRTNCRFAGEASSNVKQRPEGIRLKHWVEENSIKMYDKQGSVLRIETTINNPHRFYVRRKGWCKGKQVMKWLRLRLGIADIRRRAELSSAANARYLQALSVVGNQRPSFALLDQVSQPVKTSTKQHRALRPTSPEDASLFRVIMQGEFLLQGFRNRDLREALRDDPRNNSARITRLLALLRAHTLIFKVNNRNYYRITAKGREVMATALRFRQSDIVLLAA